MPFSLLIVKKIANVKGGSGERVKVTTPKIPIPTPKPKKKEKMKEKGYYFMNGTNEKRRLTTSKQTMG